MVENGRENQKYVETQKNLSSLKPQYPFAHEKLNDFYNYYAAQSKRSLILHLYDIMKTVIKMDFLMAF